MIIIIDGDGFSNDDDDSDDVDDSLADKNDLGGDDT